MLNNKVYYALTEYLYQMYEADEITFGEYEHARDDLARARIVARNEAKEC